MLPRVLLNQKKYSRYTVKIKWSFWHSYFVVSVSDFQYDTTQWYDNFIIPIAIEITKQVRLNNNLSHLWLIIFATEIAKTMLFHTTVYYVCNWDSIATVLKWQFCFYSVANFIPGVELCEPCQTFLSLQLYLCRRKASRLKQNVRLSRRPSYLHLVYHTLSLIQTLRLGSAMAFGCT